MLSEEKEQLFWPVWQPGQTKADAVETVRLTTMTMKTVSVFSLCSGWTTILLAAESSMLIRPFRFVVEAEEARRRRRQPRRVGWRRSSRWKNFGSENKSFQVLLSFEASQMHQTVLTKMLLFYVEYANSS